MKNGMWKGDDEPISCNGNLEDKKEEE